MNKTIFKDSNDNRLSTMRARGCNPMGSRLYKLCKLQFNSAVQITQRSVCKITVVYKKKI